MDPNGGWIASASTPLCFLDAFNDTWHSKLLDERNIRAIAPIRRTRSCEQQTCSDLLRLWLGGPAGGETQGRYTKWHIGWLHGASSLMVAHHDGINCAVLFDSDSDRTGKSFSDIVDPRCTGLPIRSRTAPQTTLIRRSHL
jgi:hypothetical protein